MELNEVFTKADQAAKDWAEAYKAAVLSGNDDAQKALLKLAPKAQRVMVGVKRIEGKRVSYAVALDSLKAAPVVTGTPAEILTAAAVRASSQRKANAVERVVSDLNSWAKYPPRRSIERPGPPDRGPGLFIWPLGHLFFRICVTRGETMTKRNTCIRRDDNYFVWISK